MAVVWQPGFWFPVSWFTGSGVMSSCHRPRRLCDASSVWRYRGSEDDRCWWMTESRRTLCVESTVAVCVSVWQSSTPRTSSVWVNDCCGCVRQSSFGIRGFGPMRQRSCVLVVDRILFYRDGCVPGFPGVFPVFRVWLWVKLSHLRVYLIESAVFDTCVRLLLQWRQLLRAEEMWLYRLKNAYCIILYICI